MPDPVAATQTGPRFTYQALKPDGVTVKGERSAPDSGSLVRTLLAEGLTATAIEPLEAASKTGSLFSPRIPNAERALLTRQLATLVEGQVRLPEALAALARQSEHKGVQALVTKLQREVTSGTPLATAMAAYPRVFSPVYRALVDVGAESGNFGAVLTRLADHLESSEALKQKLLLAALYPILVAIIAIGVIVAMLTFVMPQVISVFQSSKQTLPWLTQALINASEFLRANGLWVTLAAVASVTALWVFAGGANTRPLWDRFVLRLPVIGRVVKQLDTTRYLQTLAILTAAGAPILRSLTASEGVLTREPHKAALAEARASVERGTPLSEALKAARVHSPMAVELVSNGEATGQLAAMLTRAADNEQRALERRIAWLTGLLEPVLIVLMGGLVLALVLAVMLPIVSLNKLIR